MNTIAVRVLLTLLAVNCWCRIANAQSPVNRLPGEPPRGMVFLASDIGDSVSPSEVLDFVNDCRINLVVLDFAWITYHWPRAKMQVLSQLSEQLAMQHVRVAAMYRPRALRPADADVHFAQSADGQIADSHNDLCLAHEDSQAWGSRWGAQILTTLPSVDTIIVYNLRANCQCPACRDGNALGHASQFLERCRTEWKLVRSGVQIGHVGLSDEFAQQVDWLCPFVAVNRDADDRPPLEFPASELQQLQMKHPGQLLAPLLKTCWNAETHNSTDDVVQMLRSCETAKVGFLLWYYEWLLHSDDHRYDQRALVKSLGGDWSRLARYYQVPSKDKQSVSTGDRK